jgi:tetratricopeptide (TPR) repeat protein
MLIRKARDAGILRWAQLFALCGAVSLPALASIDHADAPALPYRTVLEQAGIMQAVLPAAATNLDLLATALRERLVTNALSDVLHMQLAWVCEIRARQSLRDLATAGPAERKDFAGARKWFEAAMRDDPGRSEPYAALGATLARLGDQGGASLLRKALAINPNDANALNNLGYNRYVKKDFKSAAGYYTRAIEIVPTHSLAHYNLAIVCVETGEYDRGIAEWRIAQKLGYRVYPSLLQELERRKRVSAP